MLWFFSTCILIFIVYIFVKDLKEDKPAVRQRSKKTSHQSSIAVKPKNTRIKKDLLKVKSLSSDQEYYVDPKKIECTCPDWNKRRKNFEEKSCFRACKHLTHFYYLHPDSAPIKELRYLALVYGDPENYRGIPPVVQSYNGEHINADSGERFTGTLISRKAILADRNGEINDDQWFIGGLKDLCVLYNPHIDGMKVLGGTIEGKEDEYSALQYMLKEMCNQVIHDDHKSRFETSSALVTYNKENKLVINVKAYSAKEVDIEVTFSTLRPSMMMFEMRRKNRVYYSGKFFPLDVQRSERRGIPLCWRWAEPWLKETLLTYKDWRSLHSIPPEYGDDLLNLFI